ncbi:hypothetical protein EJ08DRAFT_415473 [Tothia fuscella]|uniref:Uncharacterized protein n=1 Tax=Tothia fuscella TaxID=1048955 RepID=A0A9P4NJW4_9PEZI|nr:hypothetical protein EJ08DRAFT_415473 [Tothia fuscella]
MSTNQQRRAAYRAAGSAKKAKPAKKPTTPVFPDIVFPYQHMILKDSKYTGKHPLCQHPASPLGPVDLVRCICPWRCLMIYGHDTTPSPTIHLPRMQQVDPTQGKEAPSFFVLGGLHELQVTHEDVRRIRGKKYSRNNLTDAELIEDLCTRESLGIYSAILFEEDELLTKLMDFVWRHPFRTPQTYYTLRRIYVRSDGEYLVGDIAAGNHRA